MTVFTAHTYVIVAKRAWECLARSWPSWARYGVLCIGVLYLQDTKLIMRI